MDDRGDGRSKRSNSDSIIPIDVEDTNNHKLIYLHGATPWFVSYHNPVKLGSTAVLLIDHKIWSSCVRQLMQLFVCEYALRQMPNFCRLKKSASGTKTAICTADKNKNVYNCACVGDHHKL